MLQTEHQLCPYTVAPGQHAASPVDYCSHLLGHLEAEKRLSTQIFKSARNCSESREKENVLLQIQLICLVRAG